MRIAAALLSTMLLSASVAPGADKPIEISTQTYRLTIVDRCEPGVLICRDVVLNGENKKTGEKIQLKGESDIRYCADGKTPCEQLGYIFIGENIIYEYFFDGRLWVSTHIEEQNGKTQ